MLISFVDESGTASPASGEQFFTVALLLVQEPRLVETLVRRVRRSLHRRARISELKAARSHPGVIRRLMAGLAAIECKVYVITVDKQSVAPQQSEAVYRAAVAWAFEQKYASGNDWAAQIIAEQVIVEEVVQGSKIAARPGDR